MVVVTYSQDSGIFCYSTPPNSPCTAPTVRLLTVPQAPVPQYALILLQYGRHELASVRRTLINPITWSDTHMAKRTHLAKASALNALSAKKGASFYVVAAAKPTLNSNTELAQCKCGSCGFEFASNAGMDPFCAVCGGEASTVEVSGVKQPTVQTAGAHSAISCTNPECSAINIFTPETAAAFNDVMHCIMCSQELPYEYSADDEDESDGDSVVDWSDADELPADDSSDMGGKEVRQDAADVSGDEVPADDASDAGDTDADGDAPAGTEDDGDADADDQASGEEDSGDEADDKDEETSSEDPGAEVKDTESAEPEANPATPEVKELEVVMADVVKGEFSLATSGADMLVASIGSVPVATLERSKAGAVASLMTSKSFRQAVTHAARSMGVTSALTTYGFEMVTAKIDMPGYVAEQVTAKTAEVASTFEARSQELAADFEQCLGMAAAGLAKNLFKGRRNVLRDAFVQELSASGLRNAEVVVDRVIANHGMDYNRALMETAQYIMAKSEDSRNELASMIGDMNYVAGAKSTETASIEERLVNPLRKSEAIAAAKDAADASRVEAAFTTGGAETVRAWSQALRNRRPKGQLYQR